MILADFMARLAEQPEFELVYSDQTMCIIRCRGPWGERRIRLGLWAVRRMRWEDIVAALRTPARLQP